MPVALTGRVSRTLKPVPGPLRILTDEVVRTVLPIGKVPGTVVGVRVGELVGVRVGV